MGEVKVFIISQTALHSDCALQRLCITEALLSATGYGTFTLRIGLAMRSTQLCFVACGVHDGSRGECVFSSVVEKPVLYFFYYEKSH